MKNEMQMALEKQNPWWFDKSLETGITRLKYYPLLQKYLNTSEILLLLGARRTGKSTLIYQLISSLKVNPKSILFINLDEPLFQSKSEEPNFLTKLIEEYTTQNQEINKFYIFIDEVQNYNYWVQTIKTFHDINKKLKFVLTGSTSILLKDALATRLSGRYITTIIYPLSFQEYLEFNNLKKLTIAQRKNSAYQYLKYGGFPRVVLEKDKTLKRDILKNYYQTIYLKDIIFPHKIRNNKDVFDLLYFILSNVGIPFSYTNIGKTLNISTDTIIEYLSYAEQSYLIYFITKYDPSVRKQLANPRKIYCLDTGMINSISFQFSENRGRLIENLVFMTMIKQQKEVYYHKDTSECDFIIREDRKIIQAIQITVSLAEETVKKRELKGLLEALNKYSLKEGTIITEEEKDTLEIEGKKIHVVPLYEWLEQN